MGHFTSRTSFGGSFVISSYAPQIKTETRISNPEGTMTSRDNDGSRVVALILAGMLLGGFLHSPLLSAGSDSALGSEMRRLNVRTALVLQSQAVDEHPIWSPQGDAIAVNVEKSWKQIDLRSIKLVEGTWHGKERIGVSASPRLAPIEAAEVKAWAKVGTTGPRKLVTKDGTSIELRQDDLSSRFVITKKGAAPETLWTSGMETCHSLALSPDEHFVAFLCETSGIFVTAL
jgi:hypothetical protein